MEQFVVHTNQSILYSNTCVFLGSMTGGKGPDRRLVLCYWLIPNRNAKQYIGISLGRGSGVLRTKGLDGGSNGRIILGGAAFNGAFVRFTGLLTCGGVVPTAV